MLPPVYNAPPDSLSPPAARLLDLTRLVSRAGRGPHTGIDRVEAAYLQRFLEDPIPLFGFVQQRYFNALLDRDGTQALADRIFGKAPWGSPRFSTLFRRKMTPAQRRAESDVRRLALEVGRIANLPSMFHRHLPKGTALISVGQGSALREPVFDAIHALEGGRVHVLLHDTIPLDYPTYMVPATVQAVARRMPLISAKADLVICNSEHTRASGERHFAMAGRCPPTIVVHLGIELPLSGDPSRIPAIIDQTKPYFVVLGTIDPRKNHALLLDIWEHFARTLPHDDIPQLVIAGARGWLNEGLFKRLDSSPMMGQHVFEFAGLDDHAVSALVEGARALLMPSHIEGFGLPPGEALLLGTPVIANDLPIYHEVYGNNLIYLNVVDMYPWAEQVLELARAEKKVLKAADEGAIKLPTWQEHFNLVLKVT